MELNKYVHSYSSGNAFKDNVSAWLLKYIFKHRFPTYPAFGRGLSAEFGCYATLRKLNQLKDISKIDDLVRWYFKKRVAMAQTDKYLMEVENAVAITKQFVKALQERQLMPFFFSLSIFSFSFLLTSKGVRDRFVIDTILLKLKDLKFSA